MTAAAQQRTPSRREIEAALAIIDQFDRALCAQFIAELNGAVQESAKQNIAFEVLAEAAELERRATPAQPVAVPVPPRPVRVQERAAATPVGVGAGAWRIFGLASFVFGLLLWVPGAHYQLDGLTMLVNVVLEMIRVGYQIPLATGWWALLLIVCGTVYSISERRFLPARKAGSGWRFLGWGAVLVWALVNGSDMLSVYIGIAQPPADDAWPITRWMTATPWATIVWMLVVVYIGDILITLGIRWMGIPIPRFIRRLWE